MLTVGGKPVAEGELVMTDRVEEAEEGEELSLSSDSEIGDALDYLDSKYDEEVDGAFSIPLRRPNAHGGIHSCPNASPLQPLANRMQRFLHHIRTSPLEEWEGRINVGISNSVTTEIRGNVRDMAIGKTRTADKADRATVEQAIDPRTRMILHKMHNRGEYSNINGCISTGKEANVYHATKSDGQELAIKIYKTSVLVFKKCSSLRLTPSCRRHFSATTESKLKDKVALITGAASGIGKETATKFINNGAKVVLADIQTDQGREAARDLGPNASFVHCDVTRESDVSRAVDFTVSRYNHLDIMYNNAGIACQTPPSIADLDLATFDRVMSVNVRGVLAGIKHGARVMIPRRRGVILCTASVTGLLGGLAQHTYSVSKSSVIGIVRSVAAEMVGHGIRVNCISPMAIATPFVVDELRKYYPGVDQERLVQMVRGFSVLKGASCEPSDVANAAVFLASDDAKFVSGHNLVVDGGFTSFKSLSLPTADQVG